MFPEYVEENQEEVLRANETTGKRKRLSKKIIIDQSTEVSSAELLNWRDNYMVNIKRQHVTKKARLAKEAAPSNANLMIWGFGDHSLHPALKAVFCTRPPQLLADMKHPIVADCEEPVHLQSQLDVEFPVGQTEDDVEIGRRAVSEDRDFSIRGSTLPWNISREGSFAPPLSIGAIGLTSGSITGQDFSYLATPTRRLNRPSVRLPGSGLIGMGGLERLDSQDPPVEEFEIDDERKSSLSHR